MLEAACMLTGKAPDVERTTTSQSWMQRIGDSRAGSTSRSCCSKQPGPTGMTGERSATIEPCCGCVLTGDSQLRRPRSTSAAFLSNVANKFLLDGFFSVERTGGTSVRSAA